MLYYNNISKHKTLSDTEIQSAVTEAIEKASGGAELFIVPPDITRIHSHAGRITELIWDKLGQRVRDIMPALGTHKAMTEKEIATMFGAIPPALFREHRWREDIQDIGEVPGEYLSMISESKIDYSWPVQLNEQIYNVTDKLIVSVGQVVPHEVIGMANYNKNILIGCGGPESINKSHFLGAVYGMERIMGKASNPVRELLNFGESAFISHLNILYVLTVIGNDQEGKQGVIGLFIGDDPECFEIASDLSAEINIIKLDKGIKKALVYLNPEEYRSTWLGNKAIYRLRMAMADNAELIILAPGIESFGEDPQIDLLIRKYGYRLSEEVLELVKNNDDLKNNLGVAAHLIHGSTENRFKVTYCTEKISKEEIESVGYNWEDPKKVKKKYDIDKLEEGFNIMEDNEEIFYVSNPALGLWRNSER